MTTSRGIMSSFRIKEATLEMMSFMKRKRRRLKVEESRELQNSFNGQSARFILSLVSLIGLIVSVTIGEGQATALSDYDGVTFYKATVGSRVRMACNGSHWSDESVSLVLWFKGSNSVPIYTVDARGQKSLSAGARHFVSDAYKGRAKFQTRATPAYLDLSPLEEDDQAEFRCRIDYRSKPRENFLVILFVLVPPKNIQVIDSSGRSVEQIYGPLSEGADVTLQCLSFGGRPAPAVTWRQKLTNRVIDDSYLTVDDFLALRHLARSAPPNSGQNLSSQVTKSKSWSAHELNFGENSINAQASLASLESVYYEWKSWPEFDFWLSRSSNWTSSLGSNVTSSTDAMETPASLAATPMESAKSRQERHSPPASGAHSSPARHLLEMSVHESFVTSVNVLQLNALAARTAPDTNSRGLSEELRASDWSIWPQLECQASNLHYDLRSLIRIFAPNSLLVGRSNRSSQNSNSNGESTSREASSSQLVEAIEKARESTLSSANSWPDQQQANGQVEGQEQLSSGDSRQPLVSDDPRRAATLIYQQLVHSHQLSSGSGSSSSLADQQLTRNKLISLEIYFKPSDVRITSQQRAHSAGQQAEFSCTCSGSRPAAKLSWLIDDQLMDPQLSRQLDHPNSNITISKLNIQLERKNHGAKLTCRAENEKLSELASKSKADSDHQSTIEDSQLLTVHYAPILRLELGNKMLSEAIKESSDIYFVCHVDSNPPVKEITWLHDERPINDTNSERPDNDDLSYNDKSLEARDSSKSHSDKHETKGINFIMSNNSLVLQRVKLKQRGFYACIASNSEGITESNRIKLRVLHAPICRAPKRQPQVNHQIGHKDSLLGTWNMAINSRAKLLCQFEAEPPDIEVSWYLNNTQNQHKLISTTRANNKAPNDENQRQPEFSSTNRADQVAGQATESKPTNLANKMNGLIGTQLEYLVESNLDYGQLYCVAKNSVGEQKSSCVYKIQAPDPNEIEPISCVAINVTANSVSIGCDQTIKRTADSTSNGRQKVYSFSVVLHKLINSNEPVDEQDDNVDEFGRQRRLEVELKSGLLDEPLFSISHLQESTSYELQIYSLDVYNNKPSSSRPSLVTFVTPLANSVVQRTGNLRNSSPSIEPISESQQEHLMAALISTRSTNGLLSVTGPQDSETLSQYGRQVGTNKQPNRRPAVNMNQQKQTKGLLWWLWDSSVGLLFNTNNSVNDQNLDRGIAPVARGRPNSGSNTNHLMDVNDTLLVSGVCIGSLVLLMVLFVLHRYSVSEFCAGRRVARKAEDIYSNETEDDDILSTDLTNIDLAYSSSTCNRLLRSTPTTTTTETTSCMEPAASSTSNSQTGAHLRANYSSATLDAKMLSSRHPSQIPLVNSHKRTAGDSSIQMIVGHNIGTNGTNQRRNAVTRSRSSASVCLDSMGITTASSSNSARRSSQVNEYDLSQQSRLMQVPGIEHRLISDANFMAMPSSFESMTLLSNSKREQNKQKNRWPHDINGIKDFNHELCIETRAPGAQVNLNSLVVGQSANCQAACGSMRHKQLEYPDSKESACLEERDEHLRASDSNGFNFDQDSSVAWLTGALCNSSGQMHSQLAIDNWRSMQFNGIQSNNSTDAGEFGPQSLANTCELLFASNPRHPQSSSLISGNSSPLPHLAEGQFQWLKVNDIQPTNSSQEEQLNQLNFIEFLSEASRKSPFAPVGQTFAWQPEQQKGCTQNSHDQYIGSDIIEHLVGPGDQTDDMSGHQLMRNNRRLRQAYLPTLSLTSSCSMGSPSTTTTCTNSKADQLISSPNSLTNSIISTGVNSESSCSVHCANTNRSKQLQVDSCESRALVKHSKRTNRRNPNDKGEPKSNHNGTSPRQTLKDNSSLTSILKKSSSSCFTEGNSSENTQPPCESVIERQT